MRVVTHFKVQHRQHWHPLPVSSFPEALRTSGVDMRRRDRPDVDQTRGFNDERGPWFDDPEDDGLRQPACRS